MAEVADGGGGLPFPTFAVEITSLGDFLAFIERELGVPLDAGVDRVMLDAGRSQAFAAGLAGPMISTSRHNHVHSQRFPVENLVRYLFTGVAMLEVIEQLMERYKNTEELATLTTADVQGFLSAAYQQKYQDLQAVKVPASNDSGLGTAPSPVTA